MWTEQEHGQGSLRPPGRAGVPVRLPPAAMLLVPKLRPCISEHEAQPRATEKPPNNSGSYQTDVCVSYIPIEAGVGESQAVTGTLRDPGYFYLAARQCVIGSQALMSASREEKGRQGTAPLTQGTSCKLQPPPLLPLHGPEFGHMAVPG